MPQDVKQIGWKTFFAGLVCGGLAVGGGLYFFYSPSDTPTAISDPAPRSPAESDSAVANFSTAPGAAAAKPSDPVQVQLRLANFPCEQETIEKALELKRAGWTYMMPEPRDARARWGNSDTRTTWWVGYWNNERNHTTSAGPPQRNSAGQWVGDGKGVRYWRRGGSPTKPTKIEWLCSTSGGITPQ